MEFTLRIFIAGLVALVPYQDDGKLSLVVQNATGHNHLPVVLYEVRNVDRPEAFPVQLDLAGQIEESRRAQFGAHVLLGERISLNGGRAGAVKFESGRRSRWYQGFVGAVPRRVGAVRDFSWVAPMGKIFPPSLGRIEESHLKTPSASQVSGVWSFEGVEAVASTFSLYDEGREIESHTFKKSPGALSLWDTKQAWADIVLLEVKISEPQAELVFARFDGGEVRLKLSPVQGDEFVDIVVGNFYLGTDTSNHFPLYCQLSESPGMCPQTPQPGFRNVRREFHEVQRDYLPRLLRLIDDAGGAGGPLYQPGQAIDPLSSGSRSVRSVRAATGLANRLICTGGAAFTPPP